VAFAPALLSAVPEPDYRLGRSGLLCGGEVANPANAPSDCYFHPRCAYAEEVCRSQTPAWEKVSSGQFVSCHCAAVLKLHGIEALDEIRG
jgi:peptide/nickel transport system ATP-binding protein